MMITNKKAQGFEVSTVVKWVVYLIALAVIIWGAYSGYSMFKTVFGGLG